MFLAESEFQNSKIGGKQIEIGAVFEIISTLIAKRCLGKVVSFRTQLEI